MNKYIEIIKLLERIFGKSAVSKSLGTRTNVVRLPRGKQGLDPTTRHFDVEGTAKKNPELVNTIKNSVEDRMGDITRMNDQELLTYKQNLQRLADHVDPPALPSADIISAGSKQRVTGEGIEALKQTSGQTNPPGTIVGNIESRINKLKQIGQEMEKTTGKKVTLTDVLKDFGASQSSMSRINDEGLVRATARQILINDIKAGKIKNITVSEAINMKEPIDPFRQIYGEGALEQLDSLIPDLRNLKTETEAEKLARSKFKFEPDEARLPGSVSIEEGRKAEQEFGISSKIEEEIKPEGIIIPFKKKITEPENKADGGSIGLDYLMGIDNRPKYAGGGDVKKILDLIAKANKELKGKKSIEGVNPKTGEVTIPKEPVKTARTTADIEKEIDELSTTPITTLEKKRKYNDLHSEFINSLDPRKQKKALDYRRKSLDMENRLLLKAEEKGLDFDTFEELRKGLYDSRKQKTLNFIKTGKVDLEPLKSVTTFEEAQERFKTAAKAADEIFPDYTQPKTAANSLAEVMAEQKYKKTFDELSGDKQSELYSEAYNYITSVNRLPKVSPERVPPEVLQNKMNEVLNSYDKSMFIKNDQGMVDVANPENIAKMEELLRKDHPELHNQLKKLADDVSQKETLLDFDVTGRKPNKDGGLNHLLGF